MTLTGRTASVTDSWHHLYMLSASPAAVTVSNGQNRSIGGAKRLICIIATEASLWGAVARLWTRKYCKVANFAQSRSLKWYFRMSDSTKFCYTGIFSWTPRIDRNDATDNRLLSSVSIYCAALRCAARCERAIVRAARSSSWTRLPLKWPLDSVFSFPISVARYVTQLHSQCAPSPNTA